jgi:Holliday junction resolvasome RuvABC DNA-binding subunit
MGLEIRFLVRLKVCKKNASMVCMNRSKTVYKVYIGRRSASGLCDDPRLFDIFINEVVRELNT